MIVERGIMHSYANRDASTVQGAAIQPHANGCHPIRWSEYERLICPAALRDQMPSGYPIRRAQCVVLKGQSRWGMLARFGCRHIVQ